MFDMTLEYFLKPKFKTEIIFTNTILLMNTGILILINFKLLKIQKWPWSKGMVLRASVSPGKMNKPFM